MKSNHIGMNQEAWIVYSALLDETAPQEKQKLLRCLSSEASIHLGQITRPQFDYKHGISPEQMFTHVHPSWFSLWLRNLPKKQIQFLLSAFPKPQQDKIKDFLRFTDPSLPLSPQAKEYAWTLLSELFFGAQKNLRPIHFVQDHPLFALWNTSYTKLQQLITLLGMFDIGHELKKIIDNSLHKKLIRALLPLQQKFLEKKVFEQPGVIFKEMGLSKWNEDPIILQKTIHNRGLNRIAKAFYPLDPHLRTYLLYRYSLEEASHIEKLSKPLETRRSEQILQDQLMQTLQLIGEE